jgi:hypothetical protein
MDSGEESKGAVRACLETITHNNSDALDRILSPDYVLHDPALPGDVLRRAGSWAAATEAS